MGGNAHGKEFTERICVLKERVLHAVLHSKSIYRFPEQLQLVIGVIGRHSRDVRFSHVHLHREGRGDARYDIPAQVDSAA